MNMINARIGFSVAALLLVSCTPDSPEVQIEYIDSGFRATLVGSVFVFGMVETDPCVSRMRVFQSGRLIWSIESEDVCADLGAVDYSVVPRGFVEATPALRFERNEGFKLHLETGPTYCYDFGVDGSVRDCEVRLD